MAINSTAIVPPADETTITRSSGALAVKDGGVSSAKLDTDLSSGLMPVGSIIAWHKSYTNTPALLSGWVECNGQTLSDAESVYNGQIIPDLNSAVDTGLKGRFLRGHTTSGLTEADAYRAHDHSGGVTDAGGSSASSGVGNRVTITNTGSSGGSETRPYNFSVVWIIRIK